MAETIYTDSYGDVTEEEWKVCRKHNVSPSDHDMLVEVYGRSDHEAIVDAIKKFSRNGSYQEYDMIKVARQEGRLR